MFRRRTDFDPLSPLWNELHDLEGRVGLIEQERSNERAKEQGAAEANARRMSRRQKFIVIGTSSAGVISTLVNILTKLHVI